MVTKNANGRNGDAAAMRERKRRLKIARRLRYPPDVMRATRFTPRATGIMTASPIKT